MAVAHYEPVWIDDLENDEALNLCSAEAWKFWVRMFLYMGCKSPERGRFLKRNGEPPTDEETARIFRMQVASVRILLEELETNGVFSKEGGVIISRRQRRDANRCEKNSQNAQKRWNKKKTTCETDTGRNATRNAKGDATSGVGIWNMESSSEEGVQREEGAGPSPPASDPAPVAAVVAAFNRGLDDEDVRLPTGSMRIPPARDPSGATKKRDAKLREALLRFPEAVGWYWCARALAASPHHRGQNGWVADLPWLLARGNGLKLEEWMHKGVMLRTGDWTPPATDGRRMSVAEAQLAESVAHTRMLERREGDGPREPGETNEDPTRAEGIWQIPPRTVERRGYA